MKTEHIRIFGIAAIGLIFGLFIGATAMLKWDTYCLFSEASALEAMRLQRDHCVNVLERDTDWKVEFLESGVTLFYKDTAAEQRTEDLAI